MQTQKILGKVFGKKNIAALLTATMVVGGVYSTATNSNFEGIAENLIVQAQAAEPVIKTATAQSKTATITVIPKKANITANLDTTEKVYKAKQATTDLKVTATGEGTLSYQWYRNTTNNTSTGTAISGATTNTYKPSSEKVGTAYYYCVITDTVNGLSNKVSTNAAKITVNANAPVITKDLTVNTVTYTKGDTAVVLSIEAKSIDGGVISYQWFKDGKAISGATTNTYKPETTAVGTSKYHCVVTNTCKNDDGTTVDSSI